MFSFFLSFSCFLFVSAFLKQQIHIDTHSTMHLGTWPFTETGFLVLIFTNETSLVTNSGTHPSLHVNRYHQITFYKVNLKIKYLPPSQHLIWNHRRADPTFIITAICMLFWKFLFSNKSVHEQVFIFSNTFMNIFSNYIPNKFVNIDDKDPS